MSNREAAAAITAEREAFEKWARDFGMPTQRHALNPESCYAERDATMAWHGWQARALSAPVAAQPAASGLSKFVHADDATRERIGEVVAERAFAAQEAAYDMDAKWVEQAMQLADEVKHIHGAWMSEVESGASFNAPDVRRLYAESGAAREALRAHLSTALTGAAKEVK